MALDQRGRHGHRVGLHQLQNQLLGELIVALLFGLGLELLLDVVLQGRERLELAHVFGKLVVGRRQHALFDIFDRDRKLGRLTLELGVRVLRRHRHVGRGRVAAVLAEHGLFDLRQQRAGAELDLKIGGARVVDRLAVDRHHEVDGHRVARNAGARGLRRLERGVRAAHGVELFGDRLVGDLDLRTLGAQTLVRDRRDLRQDLDASLVREGLVLFDALRFDGGRRDRLQLLVGDGLRKCLVYQLLRDVGRDARAVQVCEHFARGLARAKAADLRRARNLAVRLLELRRDSGDAYLDVELHQNRAQPLNVDLHLDHDSGGRPYMLSH